MTSSSRWGLKAAKQTHSRLIRVFCLVLGIGVQLCGHPIQNEAHRSHWVSEMSEFGSCRIDRCVAFAFCGSSVSRGAAALVWKQLVYTQSCGSPLCLPHQLTLILWDTCVTQLLCQNMNDSYCPGLFVLLPGDEINNHGLRDMDPNNTNLSKVPRPPPQLCSHSGSGRWG